MAEEGKAEAAEPASTAPQGKQVKKLPLNFGKRLAHTDKPVRDRGFKIFREWLRKHTQLDRLDFMKLWKGLFYGMWMADKRPVQQELSVNIALLIGIIPRHNQGLWIDAFWETMKAEYEHLDKHRLNKYLLFMRIVLAEAFKALRVGGWDLAEVRGMTDTLLKSVPSHAKAGHNVHSLGIILQLNRILWDELGPQLAEKPAASTEVVMHFLDPFITLAEGCALDALVRSVHLQIVRRTPPEYCGALVKRLLTGAAREGLMQKNRDALYESADELEKEIIPEQPHGKNYKGPPPPAPKPTGKLMPERTRKRKRGGNKEVVPAKDGDADAEPTIRKKRKRNKTKV